MKTFTVAAIAGLALAGQAAAGEVWLTVDHARPYDTGSPVGSIVVGNPAIADVDVRGADELVLLGRTVGSTNITLYGQDGALMRTLFVSVRNPSSNRLTLHAGATRYTYNCTDVCVQIPTSGDGAPESRITRTATNAEGPSIERVQVDTRQEFPREQTLAGDDDPQS